MANELFFETLFPPDFWSSMDRSRFITDDVSMFGDVEAFDWLIKTVRPEILVELGSWQGHSANYMIDRCKKEGVLNPRIICVDTYEGGPEHWINKEALPMLKRLNGMPRLLDALLGNTVARGNEGNVFPFPADTFTAGEVMRQFGLKADLIFIDAGHAYHQVVQEVEDYLPVLSERGVMFGDDYQFEPVANAVHDMARKLGFGVAVISRKWVFINQALMRYLGPTGLQVRTTREGWVHP